MNRRADGRRCGLRVAGGFVGILCVVVAVISAVAVSIRTGFGVCAVVWKLADFVTFAGEEEGQAGR